MVHREEVYQRLYDAVPVTMGICIMKQDKELDFGELAASTMHDIQGPLAILQMTAQSLQGINERHYTFANEAVKQISDIATDFMEQYHAPNLEVIANCTSIPLAPILLTAVLLKQQLFAHRDIKFECITPRKADDVYVQVSPALLKRLTVSMSSDAKHAIFMVKDSGCGMGKQHLLTVLKKGISIGKPDTDARKGCGIGLVTARQWVENWQGTLEVSSKKGHGTTVSITLPRAPA